LTLNLTSIVVWFTSFDWFTLPAFLFWILFRFLFVFFYFLNEFSFLLENTARRLVSCATASIERDWMNENDEEWRKNLSRLLYGEGTVIWVWMERPLRELMGISRCFWFWNFCLIFTQNLDRVCLDFCKITPKAYPNKKSSPFKSTQKPTKSSSYHSNFLTDKVDELSRFTTFRWQSHCFQVELKMIRIFQGKAVQIKDIDRWFMACFKGRFYDCWFMT
jgi:hypothetical protein